MLCSAMAGTSMAIKFVACPRDSLFSMKRLLFEGLSPSNYPSSAFSSSSHLSSRIQNASRGPENLGISRSDDPERARRVVDRVGLISYSVGIGSQKKRTPSFKSPSGKRSLWRRILFASRNVRSIILLNVITVIYASDIPVVKEVEEITDPAAFSIVRFVVSAIPFIPFVVRSWDDAEIRISGVELGLWISLGYLMQALGLLTSDAGRASFISMFTVIVVPLLDGMLGAIVPARTWFGALMSILGVFMLESGGSPPSIGDLLIFLSAVFFGVHMLRTEHISRSTTKDNFLGLLGYEMCIVAVSSTLWYFAGKWSTGVQSSWTWASCWESMVAFPWIPALYTGAFSTGVCMWIEMVAMCDVSATDTAVIYGLEPLWGAGFSWFLLGERWGTAGWIGAALVLGGSLTVQMLGSSPPEKSRKREECRDEVDCVVASDNKRKDLSASPVMVSSGKNVSKLLK